METKKKKPFRWGAGLIALAAISGIFLFAIGIIKKDKEFRITTFQEVKSEVGSDGRAAVGSPEVIQVRPSPALTWELTRNNTGTWRLVAWIFVIAGALFIGLYALGILSFGAGTSAPNNIIFAIIGVAAACMFAAYSSAYENNYVELSRAAYDAIKGNVEALTKLFTDKPYIR